MTLLFRLAFRMNKRCILPLIIAAIISTIGSFSVWEASAKWIETLPELKKKERILNLLSEAEMRVKKGEENDKTEALPTATGRSSMKWCRSTSPL